MQVKDLYEFPLVLLDGGRSSAQEYLALARRANLPIQLTVADSGAAAVARELAQQWRLPVLIASSSEEAGVDLLVLDRMPERDLKKPFALSLLVNDGDVDLAATIAASDADPARRPWHYTIDCAEITHANAALASLFRRAPALAHRVIGMRANASLDFPREMSECVRLFGLQLVGGRSDTTVDDLAALLAMINA